MAQFSGGRKSNPLKRVEFVFLSFSSPDLGDERKEKRPSERTKDKRVNQCDHDIVGACDGKELVGLGCRSPFFFMGHLVLLPFTGSLIHPLESILSSTKCIPQIMT